MVRTALSRKAMRTKYITENSEFHFLMKYLLKKDNFYIFLAKLSHIDLYICEDSFRHFLPFISNIFSLIFKLMIVVLY